MRIMTTFAAALVCASFGFGQTANSTAAHKAATKSATGKSAAPSKASATKATAAVSKSPASSAKTATSKSPAAKARRSWRIQGRQFDRHEIAPRR